MGDSFVHLHVHTEYSMLDGAARLKHLFAETARIGMPALAMTDHGNLFGAYDFYKQATAAGVKPIIGIEAYVAPGSRFDRSRVRWAERRRERRLRRWGLHPHDHAGAGRRRACATCSGWPPWPASRATTTSPAWTASCCSATARGSSPPPAARAARCRPGCASATSRRPAPRRPSSRTSSAGRTSTSRSWTTASTSSATSATDLLRLGKRLDLPPVATNDLHYTLRR